MHDQSKEETHELDLSTQFTNGAQRLPRGLYAVCWKVNSETVPLQAGLRAALGKVGPAGVSRGPRQGIHPLSRDTWSWSMSASPVMTIRFSILVSEMPPFTV